MTFKKATKKQVRLKLALTGPSGSGKTYSALRLAKGIGNKIAVVDSENGSASLYSDRFDFDVIEIRPPFTTDKYINAINEAVKEKYDVVILDTISHAWAGEGGLLDEKSKLDGTGKGNSYTNWAKLTPKQEKFISAILQSDIDLIITMRSKQEYVLQDVNGKQVPRKVGMAPVQRDGIEYETTVVFDIAINHEAEASKDRTGLFNGRLFQISEEIGKELVGWRNGGIAMEPAKEVKQPTKSVVQKSKEQVEKEAILSEIHNLLRSKFKTKEDADIAVFSRHEIHIDELLGLDLEEIKEVSISLHQSLK